MIWALAGRLRNCHSRRGAIIRSGEVTDLDVIIVNWNAGSHLRACLSALSQSRQEGYRLKRVVVVDNASVDKSADNLEYPLLPLVVIRNSVNRGFGVACNQGAAGSTADHLLFLNPG